MEYQELIKRKNVVLNELQGYKFIMYAVTEQEGEEIYNLCNEKKLDYIDKVYLIATLEHIPNDGAIKELIPISKIHREKYAYGNNVIIKEIPEYKCYHGYEGKTVNNILIHEARTSSLKCACMKISSESFIILKEANGDS